MLRGGGRLSSELPMTAPEHKARPFDARIDEIDEQIAILEAKRRRIALLWLAKEAKKHDGLRARGRVLRAQVDAGMFESVHGVVSEIIRMARQRDIELPMRAIDLGLFRTDRKDAAPADTTGEP